jgi:AcrR family transcriptional regulator
VAVEQLPRGRHRLSRADVEHSQRERLLLAMTEAVADRGYATTTVADVLRRARVSRETFYEQFGNKEDCFLAAYDAAATVVATAMADALGPAEPVRVEARLERLLKRYLATLAAEPAIARAFLVEVYAAGPAALARRVEVQQRFVELVAGIVGARDESQRFACEAIVAAVSGLVTQRICAGRVAELEELGEPLRELADTVLAGAGLTRA